MSSSIPIPIRPLSFAERRRLFELPRSSWADYDTGLISAGGGVWPRSAKSVPISPQAAAVLGLEPSVTALSPDQLISAILMAPVDLLWNGGIGTYVKATGQSHADVGDRSNDAVRVDASALGVKVIGEGGNLGLTQEARIEYALAGGLVNTDFIDNSAGVDTSDHEVNIKILLDEVVRDGEMTTAGRDELMATMTDEVGQPGAGAQLPPEPGAGGGQGSGAVQMLHVHARYIRKLEREGRIRRRLDVLPADKDIAERRSARLRADAARVLRAAGAHQDRRRAGGAGLRGARRPVPEARADLATSPCRCASGSPTGWLATGCTARSSRPPWSTTWWTGPASRSRSGSTRRPVPRCPTSPRRGWSPGTSSTWRASGVEVKELDGKVEISAQILALLEGRKLTERAARWLLHFRRPPFDIQATIDYFAGGVLAVAGGFPKLLVGLDQRGFEERRDELRRARVPRWPGPLDRGDGARVLGL